MRETQWILIAKHLFINSLYFLNSHCNQILKRWSFPSHSSILSDCELCHFTSKLIEDKEDILKSFMAFNITSRKPVFSVVVESQIVIPPTIPPSQWHSRDSNLWPWLWYHLSNRELSFHFKTNWWWGRHTQIFYGIRQRGPIFRVVIGSQILVPPTATFKVQFSLVISKTQFTLAILKPNFHWKY